MHLLRQWTRFTPLRGGDCLKACVSGLQKLVEVGKTKKGTEHREVGRLAVKECHFG